MKFNKLVSILAALGVFSAGTAQAQFTTFNPDYSFVVGGYVDTTASTWGALNASIEVDFLYATPLEQLLTGINVKVTNLGPATSAITGFWLQKPTVGTVASMGTPTPYNGVPSSGWWEFQTSLPTLMNGPVSQLGDPVNSNYFGAFAQGGQAERLNVPGDSVGYFSFDINPEELGFNLGDWIAQGSATDPLLFVRWQEVVYDGSGGRSGKGAGGPGFQPGVPEPSEVAALAVLGLGGILFVRRRFTKKQK